VLCAVIGADVVGEQAFRDLMAAVCAPVTVVTAAEDTPTGTTVPTAPIPASPRARAVRSPT